MHASSGIFITVLCLGSACSDYDLVPHGDDPDKPNEDTAPLDTWVPRDTDTPAPRDTSPPEDLIPVAVCSVTPSPVAPPFESATWDGSASFDPSGGVLVHYDWVLTEQPAGSSVSMPAGDAIRGGFIPDLAGTYVGRLVVTNDSGVDSEPCYANLESVPVENLWIEMYWEHDGDDMDLHLLAPGGSLTTNTDCYYSNCIDRRLNWGDPAKTEDDPSLDLDDIPGTGPENINIQEPENGTYTVYVHDFLYSNSYDGSLNNYQPANQVTVNIYLDGSLEWTDTKGISGEESYTRFAEIDWANGTVTGF